MQEASSRRLIYFKRKGNKVEILMLNSVLCGKEYTRVILCHAWSVINNGSFITGFVDSMNEIHNFQLATECSPPFD